MVSITLNPLVNVAFSPTPLTAEKSSLPMVIFNCDGCLAETLLGVKEAVTSISARASVADTATPKTAIPKDTKLI
ncbi:MAG: hypothetical protein HC908_06960 [Calothrix sp. SM1_7_51]|nr:hypothetical protein [Calothrix sp. SM1_7_51]